MKSKWAFYCLSQGSMDQNQTGPKPTKFGKSRTEPDQDQKNLENLGPSRTDRSSDQAVRGSLNKRVEKYYIAEYIIKHINRGASFRLSFGLLSAWRSIESTTILTTHPSLHFILLWCTVRDLVYCPKRNAGQISIEKTHPRLNVAN